VTGMKTMRARLRTVAAILGCALAISGCAFGRKHAYDGNPRVPRGSLSVALAVQDQRAYVLSGAKGTNFVGLQRGGFGNPFDVTTASGQPLADDFVTSIRRGLQRAGYRVLPVPVSGGASPAQVQDALARTGAERGLVFLIQESKADTQMQTALHYGVILRVFDARGQELGRAVIGGNDTLGGSFMDPAGHAEEAVPRAFNHKLEQLLNDPSIVRALAPPPPPAPPTPPPAAPPPADAPSVTPVPAS
jgi:hypothetical protein